MYMNEERKKKKHQQIFLGARQVTSLNTKQEKKSIYDHTSWSVNAHFLRRHRNDGQCARIRYQRRRRPEQGRCALPRRTTDRGGRGDTGTWGNPRSTREYSRGCHARPTCGRQNAWDARTCGQDDARTGEARRVPQRHAQLW